MKKYKLKTEIEKDQNKKKILLEVSNSQLWFIMLGLYRLKLVRHLQKCTQKLSTELHEIGTKEYKWD